MLPALDRRIAVEAPEKVDLVWAVQGRRIPADHGYALYSALSRAVPALHGADWLSVRPIRGMHAGDGCLQLSSTARLILRLPPERIASVLPLAGRTLDVAGYPLVVGVPAIHQLKPSTAVGCGLVVVRLTKAPKGDDGKLALEAFRVQFEKEARRQLDALGVAGRLDIGPRRQLHMGRQRIIGFPVVVRELLPEHSLVLQYRGFGGKQRMGCGVFSPIRTTR
jgi:CRISPR-associated protein Cas6